MTQIFVIKVDDQLCKYNKKMTNLLETRQK